MTMSADHEQLAFAIKVLECYGEVTSHPGAPGAIQKIKQSIPYIDPETIAEYMAIWEDKIEQNGRVVWRGEHELTDCEYEVAMELRPNWQPTAQEFFEAVILLYRNKHLERAPNNG